LKKFKHHAGIIYNCYNFLVGVCPDFFYFNGGQYFFSLLGIIPKSGANRYFLFLLQGIKLLINVKDASSGKLLFPLNPEFVL